MKNFHSVAPYYNTAARHHFEPGDRLQLRGLEYQFVRTTLEGYVFGMVGALGKEFEITHSQLSTMLSSGLLALPSVHGPQE